MPSLCFAGFVQCLFSQQWLHKLPQMFPFFRCFPPARSIPLSSYHLQKSCYVQTTFDAIHHSSLLWKSCMIWIHLVEFTKISVFLTRSDQQIMPQNIHKTILKCNKNKLELSAACFTLALVNKILLFDAESLSAENNIMILHHSLLAYQLSIDPYITTCSSRQRSVLVPL